MADMSFVKENLSEKKHQKVLEEYHSFVADFRKRIPPIRNQVRLVDYLPSEKTHLVNITNRTDGKSFQHMGFFLEFSNKFKIGSIFVVRHYDLRVSIRRDIEQVIERSQVLKLNKLAFRKDVEYDMVYYGDKCIALIVELSNYIDLKQSASLLQYYPAMWYDEFIAPKGRQAYNEWEALKTIYQTVNRASEDEKHRIPIIGKPKILYTGNPVNFDSEVLHGLDLFNSIEESDIGKIVELKKSILLIEENEEVNKLRNLDAFGDPENDPMTTARFTMNKHNIVTKEDKEHILSKGEYFAFTLDRGEKVGCYYFKDVGVPKVYLNILPPFSPQEPFFVKNIEDMTEDSIFLADKFYSKNFVKNYIAGRVKFDNIYSKNTLFENHYFTNLNIYKMIAVHKMRTKPAPFHVKRERFEKEAKLDSLRRAIYGIDYIGEIARAEERYLSNVQ